MSLIFTTTFGTEITFKVIQHDQAKHVKKTIRVHGGEVIPFTSPSEDHVITLMPPHMNVPERPSVDIFSTSYVFECCESDSLRDLAEYRLNPIPVARPSDLWSIMMGEMSWKTARRKNAESQKSVGLLDAESEAVQSSGQSSSDEDESAKKEKEGTKTPKKKARAKSFRTSTPQASTCGQGKNQRAKAVERGAKSQMSPMILSDSKETSHDIGPKRFSGVHRLSDSTSDSEGEDQPSRVGPGQNEEDFMSESESLRIELKIPEIISDDEEEESQRACSERVSPNQEKNGDEPQIVSHEREERRNRSHQSEEQQNRNHQSEDQQNRSRQSEEQQNRSRHQHDNSEDEEGQESAENIIEVSSSDMDDASSEQQRPRPILLAPTTYRSIGNKKRESYSLEEKRAILNFIISRKCFHQLKGNTVWQKMEERGICKDRTWQSMKEHFRKNLMRNLYSFHLEREDIEKISKGYHQGAVYFTSEAKSSGPSNKQRTSNNVQTSPRPRPSQRLSESPSRPRSSTNRQVCDSSTASRRSDRLCQSPSRPGPSEGIYRSPRAGTSKAMPQSSQEIPSLGESQDFFRDLPSTSRVSKRARKLLNDFSDDESQQMECDSSSNACQSDPTEGDEDVRRISKSPKYIENSILRQKKYPVFAKSDLKLLRRPRPMETKKERGETRNQPCNLETRVSERCDSSRPPTELYTAASSRKVAAYGGRGFRTGSKFYTKEEDSAILSYIVKYGPHLIKGRQLYTDMEFQQIALGRSWHSIKERLKKVLIHKLDEFPIEERDKRKLREAGKSWLDK